MRMTLLTAPQKPCTCRNKLTHAWRKVLDYTWHPYMLRRHRRRHEKLIDRYFHHETRLTVQVCNAHNVDCCEECAKAVKLEKDYLY